MTASKLPEAQTIQMKSEESSSKPEYQKALILRQEWKIHVSTRLQSKECLTKGIHNIHHVLQLLKTDVYSCEVVTKTWTMIEAKSRSCSFSRIMESSRYTLWEFKSTQSRRMIKAPRLSWNNRITSQIIKQTKFRSFP